VRNGSLPHSAGTAPAIWEVECWLPLSGEEAGFMALSDLRAAESVSVGEPSVSRGCILSACALRLAYFGVPTICGLQAAPFVSLEVAPERAGRATE
jgi:hypothetical protein